MKSLFPLLFCLRFATVQAQNLIPNGSFEQFTSCPRTTGQVDSAIGWHNVLNTPDYFATCSPYPVSIPDNVCGSQMPFDGSGYMGLYTYAWAFPNNQERESSAVNCLIH